MKLTRIRSGRVCVCICVTATYVYIYNGQCREHMPTQKKNWICCNVLSLRNFEKKYIYILMVINSIVKHIK